MDMKMANRKDTITDIATVIAIPKQVYRSLPQRQK